MLEVFNTLRDVTPLTTLLRMALAVLCGLAIGIERSIKNRPAGIRTHILICVGATLASMTGIYLYLNAHLPADISRIGAQVVSGLGFIGAGTIIVTHQHTIKGLTTAAGLWTSGIIGLALGAGYYEGGILTTLLVLCTELVFTRVSMSIKQAANFTIWVRYQNKEALNQVMRFCKDNRLDIDDLSVKGVGEGEETVYTARVHIRPKRDVDRSELLAHIQTMPQILAADLL